MARSANPYASCPVARAIGVFQEKWVLHILHTLLDGPRGFNELGRDVGGCNPTTLTGRLARLEELGLVERSTEGGRSHYALTPAGEALRDVIHAIRAWSASYLGEGEADPEVVVHVPDLAERADAPPPASRPAPVVGRVAAGRRGADDGVDGPTATIWASERT